VTELARRLGLAGAVVLGLGGMLGTGVFVAVGPASALAGDRVLVALVIAAAVAACNATSSARLAAADPVSGGAYQWGRRHLGRAWGVLAGWCFLVGKTASAAAAALVVGLYAWPDQAASVAALVVVAATVLNVVGVQRTTAVSAVLVAFVIAVLLLVVVVAGRGAPTGPVVLTVVDPVSPLDVLAAAGVFFLAFAGYARVATLGEEVKDPTRTIPRAVALALAVVTVVYLLLVARAVATLPAVALAESVTPVADLASSSGVAGLPVVVAVAAGLAATAVLLGVLAGTSRTALAMARSGDLPARLRGVHPRWGTPWLAQVVVGVVVLVVVLAGGVVGAIVVSAVTVLVYYAVANAAALRLPGGLPARLAAVAGLIGCPVIATALLLSSPT